MNKSTGKLSKSGKPEPTARRFDRAPEVPKVAELVARELRGRIVRGELREGDQLSSETELMRQFGVSRPTMRQAVRILEAESLLKVGRGAQQGATVRTPDIAMAARYSGLVLQARGTTLADVYTARIVLEPPVAAELATLAPKTAPRALREIIAHERGLIDDTTDFAGPASRFHVALGELTGNQTITLIISTINHICEQRHAALAAWLRSQQDRRAPLRRGAIAAQERLVELIEAGDAQGAADHWRKFLLHTVKRLQEAEEFVRVLDFFE